MKKEELFLVILELERRIEQIRCEDGEWLEYQIDQFEWSRPEYAHQN